MVFIIKVFRQPSARHHRDWRPAPELAPGQRGQSCRVGGLLGNSSSKTERPGAPIGWVRRPTPIVR